MITDTDPEILVRDIEIFNEIRNCVKRKINNCDQLFLGSDYAHHREEIFEIVAHSIKNRESNIAIICGSTGTGKTALLNNVVKELCDSHVINSESALVIKLHGIMHRDDQKALQDIKIQLNLTNIDESKKFASFQDNLLYLLSCFDEQVESDLKPCLVILVNEFHMFCEHRCQTLLYNLYDIAQTNQSPLCVIGTTNYSDVVNLMEKRVVSRFSHRILWLAQNLIPEDRIKLFVHLFTLDDSDLPGIEQVYKVIWNKRITDVILDDRVREILQRQMEIDSSQSKFRNVLHRLFNTVTFDLPLMNPENVVYIFSLQDLYAPFLAKISLLEMALTIAVKHQAACFDREPFNFEMVYSRYMRFSKKYPTSLVTERSVVFKAFQRIQELEIIIPARKAVGNAIGKVPPEYQLYTLNLTYDQINQAVRMSSTLTPELRQWADHTI